MLLNKNRDNTVDRKATEVEIFISSFTEKILVIFFNKWHKVPLIDPLLGIDTDPSP